MATTIEEMTPATSAAQAGDAPDPTSGKPRPAPPNPAGAQAHSAERRRNISPNALIGGGVAVFVAIIGIIGALLVGQLMAINDGLGRLDTKIDAGISRLDTKIDAVETSLRTEMQAGFAQINAVLLDHTERLARLEAHVGLESAVPEG